MKKHSFYLLLICSLIYSCTAQVESDGLNRFEAFNGIQFEYGLLLPDGFDRSKHYEMVALLCETHINDQAWESTMERLSQFKLEEVIVILPKVPIGKDSWGTHPIHHAFNDLLKSVRKSHGHADQKFHLVGYEAGQEVSFWWTYGSANLISSTSVVNGTLWDQKHWDEKWYRNLTGSGVPIYAYEEVKPEKFKMPRIQFLEACPLDKVLKDIVDRSN